MDTEIKREDELQDDIAEFCDILKQLDNSDLTVLHQILMVEDETEQHRKLRQLRGNIKRYGNLYNAYSARVLAPNPNMYVKDEIVSRFNLHEYIEEENVTLREMVIDQSCKLERAIHAIYNLHGGLFNRETQSYILETNNALLHGEPLPKIPSKSCDIYPTTRQGDENEERIKQLEETIRILEEKINALDKRQQQVIFTL
jgi:hypothetical protein